MDFDLRRHSGRAQRGPESITTAVPVKSQLRLWIPGSRAIARRRRA